MPKMTEQDLAKALVATGLLSPQQVQTAAQMRRPGYGLAQIIVEKGWVNQIDILQVDSEALTGPTGDVAVDNGRIVSVGGRGDSDTARRTVDATGLAVSPGFFDMHTHYDAQWFWEPTAPTSTP